MTEQKHGMGRRQFFTIAAGAAATVAATAAGYVTGREGSLHKTDGYRGQEYGEVEAVSDAIALDVCRKRNLENEDITIPGVRIDLQKLGIYERDDPQLVIQLRDADDGVFAELNLNASDIAHMHKVIEDGIVQVDGLHPGEVFVEIMDDEPLMNRTYTEVWTPLLVPIETYQLAKIPENAKVVVFAKTGKSKFTLSPDGKVDDVYSDTQTRKMTTQMGIKEFVYQHQ